MDQNEEVHNAEVNNCTENLQVMDINTYSLDQVPDKDLYYKLIQMFPYINTNRIKELLIRPPFDTSIYDKNTLVSLFSDQCLEMPIDETKLIENAQYTDKILCDDLISTYIENLLSIFPNADPTFITEFVQQNYDNPTVINNFIEENVENPQYPTKDKFLEEKKFMKLRNNFIDDFKIDVFLKIYPNPFEHFENSKRRGIYNENAIYYLQKVFDSVDVTEIEEVYKTSLYNLTLTVNELDNKYPNIQRPVWVEMKDKNLVHEVAFINHKAELKNHLDSINQKEILEFEECKEKNILLECNSCFAKIIPNKEISCLAESANHIFCRSCIVEALNVKMSEGIYNLQCFTCESNFKMTDFEAVLSKTTYKKFVKKIQEVEILNANIEGLEGCPFCHFSVILTKDEKIFKCQNPKCMKRTCRKCKLLDHLPQKCAKEVKEDKEEGLRLLIEEKMTKALIRTCCNCKRSLCKEDGCNKIVCIHCKTAMCYLCNAQIEDNYKHFRAQGSDRYDLCPLWSNDKTHDMQFVRKVALEAKKEFELKNPGCQIDVANLLPEVPTANPILNFEDTMLFNEDKFTEYARIRSNALDDKYE